jgi:VWFA-related protein
MVHFIFTKYFSAIIVALICAAILLAPVMIVRATQSAQEDESLSAEVRADLPANGELRVENLRGGVSVEVWNEKYVSLKAMIKGAAPEVSLVRMARTNELLNVSVALEQIANPARVDLIIRVPQLTRAEIITEGGEVQLLGAPEKIFVRTGAGDIHAESLSSAFDSIDITARSTNGTAAYALALPDTFSPIGKVNSFHIRLGAGRKLMRLQSERGNIRIAASDAAQENSLSQTAPKPPILRGSQANATRGQTASGINSSRSPQETGEDDVIRIDTQLVTISASVVDRSTNRGLIGLSQSDFKLYEDGAEQQIERYESAAAPFNLVLLIDLSGSTREVVNLIRSAALRFVEAARPSDRIAVITFASTPIIVSRLTNDRSLLRQRINSIEQPHGSTKLYDAIDFAMSQVLKDARDSRRNAIVLMSDGLDSQLPNVKGAGSTLSYKELYRNVQEFDGVLYTLWLNTEYESLSDQDIQPETFDLAHDRMKDLAAAGGGVFYEVEKLNDLAGAYERVVADLGTVYSFSYRPTNKTRDGSWRTIRLSVARPNAVARGKRGYYAN